MLGRSEFRVGHLNDEGWCAGALNRLATARIRRAIEQRKLLSALETAA
jgi:hypothetical protein